MDIPVLFEPKRGCGRRKEGGTYLVSGGEPSPCGRFPIPVHTCPTCGQGIKPARGFTWVDGDALKLLAPQCVRPMDECIFCPMMPMRKIGKAGLIWIGSKYYPTPEDFIKEASEMGISRRVTGVPRGLMEMNEETGEVELTDTWIFLAHRQGTTRYDSETDELLPEPAIMYIWKPDEVQQVVNEEITEEEAEAIVKRGINPVIVKPLDGELYEEE